MNILQVHSYLVVDFLLREGGPFTLTLAVQMVDRILSDCRSRPEVQGIVLVNINALPMGFLILLIGMLASRGAKEVSIQLREHHDAEAVRVYSYNPARVGERHLI
ncbi:MAG: hypothetical protein V1778_01690 [bacterium]